MKNKSMVFEIIKKEIRDVVRDKKTLIMMILYIVLIVLIIKKHITILMQKFHCLK